MEYTIKLNFSDVEKFVKICTIFSDEDVYIMQGRYIVNGKSILGILSLDLDKPLTFFCQVKNETLKEKISPYITDKNF